MAIQAAKAAAASETVKVKVVAPYRVLHEGKPFVGGDQVTVPSDTADHWLKAGWVEPVPVSQKRKES